MPSAEATTSAVVTLRLLKRIYRAALVNPYPSPALTKALNDYLRHLAHPLARKEDS